MGQADLLLNLVVQKLKKSFLLTAVGAMGVMVVEEETEVWVVREEMAVMVVKDIPVKTHIVAVVAMEDREVTEVMAEVVGPEVQVGEEVMEGMLVMEGFV